LNHTSDRKAENKSNTYISYNQCHCDCDMTVINAVTINQSINHSYLSMWPTTSSDTKGGKQSKR